MVPYAQLIADLATDESLEAGESCPGFADPVARLLAMLLRGGGDLLGQARRGVELVAWGDVEAAKRQRPTFDAMTLRMLLAWLKEVRSKRRPVKADISAYIARLDSFVAGLPVRGNTRLANLRSQFYESAKGIGDRGVWFELCSAPGGAGKTVALMRHALGLAQKRGLRRIIVVEPYVSLNNQAHQVYTAAMGGAVEQHHHLAPKPDETWDAPIVVTTGAAFFSSLTSLSADGLRRLSNLRDSVVILDDAHAHCAPHLWPFYMRLLDSIHRERFAHIIIGSASLPRYWELPAPTLPPPLEILPDDLLAEFRKEKMQQVQITDEPKAFNFPILAERVVAADGSTLVVLNTQRNAALATLHIRDELARQNLGETPVFHLSNAVFPNDRDWTLSRVLENLDQNNKIILVATSLVETGIDFSFANGFRERAGAASTIQCASRVNRNGEFNGVRTLNCFILNDTEATPNPGMNNSMIARDCALNEGLSWGAELVHAATIKELALSPVAVAKTDEIEEAERYFDLGEVHRRNEPIPWHANVLLKLASTKNLKGSAEELRRATVSLSAQQLVALQRELNLDLAKSSDFSLTDTYTIPDGLVDSDLGVLAFLKKKIRA